MDCELSIKVEGGYSKIDVSGKESDMLFNWILLSNVVCRKLGITPEMLAEMLPRTTEKLRNLSPGFSVLIDSGAAQEAVQKQKEDDES